MIQVSNTNMRIARDNEPNKATQITNKIPITSKELTNWVVAGDFLPWNILHNKDKNKIEMHNITRHA